MPTTVKLAPSPRLQYVDANGNPYSGAKLFTYTAGSSSKLSTYTANDGVTANTNPIVLDSAGRTPYGVWLVSGIAYKFILALSTDTDPPASPIFTEDNINGINDTVSTSAAATSAAQWVAPALTPTYINTTQFTLAGDQTPAFHVGRRIRLTVTAGTLYGKITVSAYTTLTTVTVLLDAGVLDAGLTVADLGILTVLNPSLPSTIALSGANSDITSLTGLTTALSVAQGGTAATTAAAARTSLGSAASGANSDITSLSGLTTPLSVAQGGTGSSTGFAYFHARDEKASGTAAGTASIGIQTRTINTQVTNTITDASLASNQITLPAGTYRCEASAPGYAVSQHKAFLYNVTDSAIQLGGTSQYSFTNADNRSIVNGRFTIAAAKVFELRHYTQAAGDLGTRTNVAGTGVEIYSTIEIFKEA